MEPKKCTLIADQKIIEQVEKVEYLRIKLFRQASVDDEVRQDVNKANIEVGCLENNLWKCLLTETKTRI